jgi:cyclic beta-1,2-glucan synthetase
VQFQHFQTHVATLRTLFQNALDQFSGNGQDQHNAYTVEWLLDNAHVLQQAFQQVEEDLQPGFFIKLPTVRKGPLTGCPRIFAIARKIVHRERGRLNVASVPKTIRFLHLVDLNSEQPLRMSELWAFPIMLRIAILEVLAQTIAHVAQLKLGWTLPYDHKISDDTDDHLVAASFGSLQFLASQDWRDFFESASRVEQVLRREPAGVYAAMDKETRDHYRKAIELMADSTGRHEIAVANAALDLSEDGGHVGFFLIDAGRPQLESRLNYCPTVQNRLRRFMLRHPTVTYLGSIALATCVLIGAVMSFLTRSGASPVLFVATAAVLLITISTMVIGIVDWLMTLILPPRILPKLDFRDGIPANQRCMVVVPALLNSQDEARSLLQQLELHYLRNPDPHLYFALLSDFADAHQVHESGDAQLIQILTDGVIALNKRYARPSTTQNNAPGALASDPFYLFHRKRTWNAHENVWMGWERKRGKLHQLNQRLRESAAAEFDVEVGCMEILPLIKYVITLDADTAAKRRRASHRGGRTSAQPARFRCGQRTANCGLFDYSAAPRNHANQRKPIVVCTHLFGGYRARPVYKRGFQCVSGSVWRRHLRGKGLV